MFFFFQAEYGMGGLDVTGVQTCALPIFNSALDTAVISRHYAAGRELLP